MLKFMTLEVRELFTNSKLIVLLSVISIVSTFLALTVSADSYRLTRRVEQNFISAFGDETTLTYRISGPFSREFFDRMGSPETAVQRTQVFNELMEAPEFQFRFSFYNPIQISAGGFTGAYVPDMLSWSDRDWLAFHGLFADNLFMEQPGVSLAKGRGFSESEFWVEHPEITEVPLILGYGFEEFYQLDDIFEYAWTGLEKPVNLKVIGFLEQGSSIFINNGINVPLDYVMVIPSRQVSYDPILEDGSLDVKFLELDWNRQLTNGLLVFPQEQQYYALERAREIFIDHGFYELELISETREFLSTLEFLRGQTFERLMVAIAMAILFLAMLSIQAYYRINRYQKKFSTFILNGMNQLNLIFLINADALAILAIGNFLFIFLNNIMGNMQRTDGVSLEAVLAVGLLQLVLFGIRFAISHFLIYKMDMSATLRQRE